MNRRVRSIVLSVAFACAASPSFAALPGDVDADCDVDVRDAVLLERALAGYIALTDEQRGGADLPPIGGSTKDGIIDAGDLVTIQRLVARDANPATAPLVRPEVTIADPAANANPWLLSGTAPANAKVTLYVNGAKLPFETTANGAGQFSGLPAPLLDGVNRVTVVASSGSNQSCSSPQRMVTHTPTPISATPPPDILAGSPQYTVWTPALFSGQAPVINANYTIPSGKVLIIQPGLHVKFGPPVGGSQTPVQFNVEGNLQVLGTASAKVYFEANNASCNFSGSATAWGGISIKSNAIPRPLIQHAIIDCTFTGLSVGVTFASRLTLRDSEIKRWSSNGIELSTETRAVTIERNQLTSGVGNTAIHSTARGQASPDCVSSADIELPHANSASPDPNNERPDSANCIEILDNTLSAKNRVIQLGDEPDNILRNTIQGSIAGTTGIQIDAGAGGGAWPTDELVRIRNNTITNLCIGIEKNSGNNPQNPNFHYNNLYDNDNCSGACNSSNCKNYASGSFSSCSVQAQNNWWGTSVVSQIQATIQGGCAPQDGVLFNPYLDGPFDQIPPPASITDTSVVTGLLTNANKPTASVWTLLGQVTIPTGPAVTIPDGTTLKFGAGAELVVQGTLTVEDTQAADVLFTALTEPTVTPVAGHWKGIAVAAGGTANIADAVVEHATHALKSSGANAQLNVSGSLIRSFSQTGIRIENNGRANIHDNRNVSGTLGIQASSSTTGIAVVNAGSPVEIRNNEVKDAQTALLIDGSSPLVYGNLLKTSNSGVYITGASTASIRADGATLGNEITGNCVGIRIQSPSAQPHPVVRENKIHLNAKCGTSSLNYSVESYGFSATPQVLDAEDNYWGSTSAAEIANKIYDREENTAFVSLPTVDFVPFRDANGAAAGTDLLLGPMTSAPNDDDDELEPGSYTAAGTITVAPGTIWRIGPDVTIDFGSFGLDVQGSLVAAGASPTSRVTLQRTGSSTWGGIVASGPPLTGKPKLDLKFTTISNANTAVTVKDTTGDVSIADSELLCKNGISLENVHPSGGASIQHNEIDGPATTYGGTGTGILAKSSDAVIEDQNEIRHMAIGVRVEGSSDVEVGTGPTTGNLIELFSGAGVQFENTGTFGGIVGNTIVNPASGVATRTAQGIELIDASPEISANAIHYTYFGIQAYSGSSPQIHDGNVITDNVWGLLLRGDRDLMSPQNPQPQIERNEISNACHLSSSPYCNGSPVAFDLCPDTGGNLCMYGYLYGTNLTIDARENYWGAGIDTAQEINQKLFIENSNPIPIDVSNFRTSSGGPPGTDVAFSTLFHTVTRDPEVMRPTRVPGQTSRIQFELFANAANVVVRIFEEKNGGALVRTETLGSLTAPGPHHWDWDGKNDSSQFVADEAYRFQIEGDQVSNGQHHIYTIGQDGRIMTDNLPSLVNPVWNAHENKYLKTWMGNVYVTPMRGIMRLQDANGSLLSGEDTYTRALPHGQRRLFVFDGRNKQGQILSGLVRLGFHGLAPIRRNSIFVQDTAPSVFGEGFSPAPPSVTNVEVLSDPYLATPTYDQVSTIRYQLDQNAKVTITILKPGFADPAQPGAVAAVLVPQTAELPAFTLPPTVVPIVYSATWDGFGAGADGEVLQATQSGSYTFLIEAQHPTQSNLKSAYRGTIQVRLAPGM